MAKKNINTEIELRAAILQLESTQALEKKILKEQFHAAYESMKPINLIKSTFKEVAASTEVKNTLLNAGVGLGVGYVSKVVFQGASHSPLRKLFGTVLEFGIANVVAKNPEAVKSVAVGLFSIINSGIRAASSNKPK